MTTRIPYPSDVSDEEWAFVAPYLALVREDAPQRNHELREVFNGLRWIVRTGSAWRYMPRHTIFRRGKPSTSRRGDGCLRTSSKRWSMICAYSCAFRKAERQIQRRPYSTLAPYAPPLRAALGAAMTDTSTRRARRCTRRWTLWDTCSPCWSLRPQSRSGLGWASWRRLCKRLQASR